MISYIDIGDGQDVILFLHGLGNTRSLWDRQYELSNKYRLIVPDLPFHGESESNKSITVKSFASEIIELLEHLHIESCHVIGLSLGGIVAQEVVHQRPDLIQGLILANTTSYVPLISHHFINKQSKMNYTVDEIIHNVASLSIHNQEYLEEAKQTFHIRDEYIECSKMAVGLNYYPSLWRIKAPVLLIGGRQDRVTPPLGNILMMSPFIKNCEVKIFDDCGHLSNLERSVEFNSSIDKFIELHKSKRNECVA